MSTIWKDVSATPTRELTLEEHEATEHVLDVAAAWRAGDISTGAALQEGGGLNPHRARGLAFRFRRDDARLPALEALSWRMSASFSIVLADGTLCQPAVWQASEHHVAAFRRNGGEGRTA